jgi:hypothetical protein
MVAVVQHLQVLEDRGLVQIEKVREVAHFTAPNPLRFQYWRNGLAILSETQPPSFFPV